jgi:hypothetical protein
MSAFVCVSFMCRQRKESRMSNAALRDFASHAIEVRRIRFGDLRRLQRDILPARITSREEAEILIDLDRAVQRADPDWRKYLIATVRDFVVWGLPPVGCLDFQKAQWLAITLARGGPTRTGRIIANAVASEVRHIDPDLFAFLAVSGSRRPAALGASAKHCRNRFSSPSQSLGHGQ